MVRLTDKEILVLIELGSSASPAELRSLSPYEACLMRDMLLRMGIDLRPIHHKIALFVIGVLTLGIAFVFSAFWKPAPTPQELLDKLEIDRKKMEVRRERFKILQPFLFVLWAGILLTAIIVILASLFPKNENRLAASNTGVTPQAFNSVQPELQETSALDAPIEIPENTEAIHRYELNMGEIDTFSKSGMMKKSSTTDTSCGFHKTITKEIAYFSGVVVAYRKSTSENQTRSVQSVFYSRSDGKPYVYDVSTFEFEQEKGSRTFLLGVSGEAYPILAETKVQTESLPFSPVPASFSDPETDFLTNECQMSEGLAAEAPKGVEDSNKTYGSFPLSSTNSGATLTGISGMDTSEAMAFGKVTAEDALEYCKRDPGGNSQGNISLDFLENCSRGVLEQEQERIHKSTASCPEGLVYVDSIGTFQATESTDGQSIEWVNVETGEALMGMTSGEATVEAHYRILCPLTSKR